MRHCQSTQLLRESASWLGVPYYELQKCVITRWWSEVTSVRSVNRNRKAIEALHMKGQSPCPDLIAKLDWDFLEVLLSVMDPFAKATAAMEADKTPMIGYVVGMVVFLKKRMRDLALHEHEGIRTAAIDMQEDFDQR